MKLLMKNGCIRNSRKAALSKLNNKELSVVDYIKAECKKAGVKIDFHLTRHVRVDSKTLCDGYFASREGVIVVAINCSKSSWLPVLIHEFCHMQQWLENTKSWKLVERLDSHSKVFEWLDGKDVSKIDKHLSAIRDLELDCEKRTVKLMKKWKLPVNTRLYVREANAYIQLYNWMKEYRHWPNSAWSRKLLNKFPSTFRMDYTEITPYHKEALAEAALL
jgi:hypothetical protein